MTEHHDTLETRKAAEREAELFARLPEDKARCPLAGWSRGLPDRSAGCTLRPDQFLSPNPATMIPSATRRRCSSPASAPATCC
jgi:hypothetical protein